MCIRDRRVYLGPTSTDPDLAFLMVNQAAVGSTSVVWDPFVGTGSILLAAAHFGAFCYGSEIDMRVLQGKGVGRINHQSSYKDKITKGDIWANYTQYGFPRPEIFRMDTSMNSFRDVEIFDAIVCDPPYGIRAGARTTGRRKKGEPSLSTKGKPKESLTEGTPTKVEELKANEVSSSPEQKQAQDDDEEEMVDQGIEGEREETKENEIKAVQRSEDYIPPTKVTTCDQVVEGLFNLSRKMLRVGGRLVFLYPIDRGTFNWRNLPKNEAFELVACCENVLSITISRVLVTMKRIK
eukprot:TRINITY_DN6793_c0_g1_i1.p1 TRINITY_DN6793_c0_g1~~TRINITY_DN6793_c0_g1_i1.p1  ORF type:complete len:313 (+),score=57.21 TRINITY_DN6793_c0_g1_i1:60-941(+)